MLFMPYLGRAGLEQFPTIFTCCPAGTISCCLLGHSCVCVHACVYLLLPLPFPTPTPYLPLHTATTFLQSIFHFATHLPLLFAFAFFSVFVWLGRKAVLLFVLYDGCISHYSLLLCVTNSRLKPVLFIYSLKTDIAPCLLPCL